MNTLFNGRSEAEDPCTGNSLLCNSPTIAADTIRLMGKEGACAEFHA